MNKRSAGLLMFRRSHTVIEVFLVHPGGPYFTHKDKGAWTIPKGECTSGEDPFAAAQREFHEETGFSPTPPFIPLDAIQQAAGKLVTAWAFPGDCDPALLRSNTCLIPWPPRSGRTLEIPEIDRGAWFSLAHAGEYLHRDQLPFLTRLCAALGLTPAGPNP